MASERSAADVLMPAGRAFVRVPPPPDGLAEAWQRARRIKRRQLATSMATIAMAAVTVTAHGPRW